MDDKISRAAEFAINRYQPNLLIVEDAFHDRSIARDLNCVVIDSRIDLAKVPLHPLGPRRESLAALRRANLCVMTNVPGSAQGSMDTYKKITPAPSIGVRLIPQQFRSFSSGEEIPSTSMGGESCIVFCGIENPQIFKSALTELGVQITEFLVYPDH
jgi:tetraacyldisaccharide 4'-kinase